MDTIYRSALPASRWPLDQAWLAKRREEILDPGLPIVDPHHHLWDRSNTQYLFEDVLADIGSGHKIRATVFLQCGSMYRADGDPAFAPVGETEFVNGVAAMSATGLYGPARICAGIVGHADLRNPNAVDVLEAHIQAGGGRFRGIRQSSVWDPDPAVVSISTASIRGLLADRAFREGFAHLAPLGLSYDAWMYFPQLGELADLATAFPDTRIVLNHVGAPLGVAAYAGRRDEVFAEWSRGIRSLANHANVHVKLGGLGMTIMGFGFEQQDTPPSSEALATAWRPYIETCIAAFGVDRCMFESNFPVDKATTGYAILWNAFKRLAAGASAADKAALFHDTAVRFYRL